MRNVFGLKNAVVATATVLALSAVMAAPAMASVAVLGQSSQGDLTNTAGTGFALGYGANTPIGATWSSDPTVFVPPSQGNVGGVYQSPFNANGLTNTQSYFSVGAESGVNGALTPVTLTLAATQSVFNILWGSIDTYNSLTFLGGVGGPLTYTGSQIIAALNSFTGGSPTNSEQVALLQFDIDGGFNQVRFDSSSAAFEFAFAPIPLPPALILFGSGIAGLGILARRRKNKPNAAQVLAA